jgi:CheY-like chemotaxis protein
MAESIKILLVDDEDDLLSPIEFRLKALGYDLSIAKNGAEALEQMNREKVDVVLADFMMPEINGIELTRIIKSHPLWFDTQVVLFSCNSEPEFRRKALDLGALEYLPKTAGARAIVERICKIAPISQEVPRATTTATAGAASLARGLADMLQVAAGDETLSGSTRLAISSSQRIAEDLMNLLAAVSPAPTRH